MNTAVIIAHTINTVVIIAHTMNTNDYIYNHFKQTNCDCRLRLLIYSRPRGLAQKKKLVINILYIIFINTGNIINRKYC